MLTGRFKTLFATEPVEAANAEETTSLKTETVRWILSIACSVLVYAIVAFIVKKTYHPDTGALMEYANRILAKADATRPEPMEALLFQLGVIIIIPGMTLFYVLFSRHRLSNATAAKVLLPTIVLTAAFIIAMVYFDLAAANPFGAGNGDSPQSYRDHNTKTNFDFYFDGIFVGSYAWLYLLLIVPLFACLFFFGIRRYNWDKKRAFNIALTVIGYAITGGAVLAIIAMNVYRFPYAGVNKYDFDAVYFSMTQVYAGLPMLVNGFTNTYGLYPEFLNPFFKITGLNVLSFSAVMAMLTGLCFILNFWFLKQFVRNKVILFLGFASVIFFPYLDFKLTTLFDSVFALYPIRYLGPSVLAVLGAIYFKKPFKAIYWITFFMMACFILWNPEMGIVCFLSWVLANMYFDFYGATGKPAVRRILFHLVAAMGILAVTFSAYELIIFIVYHSWPDLSRLFTTIFVFGKVGFGLLPMKLIHPWNIVVLFLLPGFLYAGIHWHKKTITPKAAAVLLSSLLALGFFVYFQGRSHNTNLALSSGFAFLVLTIAGDELWAIARGSRLPALDILFVIFLFFISFSLVEIVADSPKIVELVYQDNDKAAQEDEQKRVESNTAFVLNNTAEGQKIYVLAPRQFEGLYFDGNKRIAAFTPGLIDLFYSADVSRLENALTDSSFTIFFESWVGMYSFLARPVAAIAATYEYNSHNRTLILLNKHKSKIPGTEFFKSRGNVILHRKYNEDKAGVKMRIADAFGIDAPALPAQFSVQVLFDAKPQFFDHATLVGNMRDSAGFVISNVFNATDYYFGINGRVFTFPMPKDGWVYCVMNVYPDHIEVFENGMLVGTHQTAGPIRQPDGDICIGNSGEFHYYVGAIAEIAINNKPLDKQEVTETWEAIRSDAIKQAINSIR
jgi:hypothetical protein